MLAFTMMLVVHQALKIALNGIDSNFISWDSGSDVVTSGIVVIGAGLVFQLAHNGISILTTH